MKNSTNSLFVFLSFLLIISCKPNSSTYKPSNFKQPQIDTCKTEKFVQNFLTTHTDGFNNDIKRKQTNEEFKTDYLNKLKDDPQLFDDIPSEFIDMKETKGGYYVHFMGRRLPSGYKYRSHDISTIGYDILGKVSSQYVDVLKDKEFYYVKGKFLKLIDSNEYPRYAQKIPYSYNIYIKKDEIYTTVTKFDATLGIIYLDIDTIIPYSPTTNLLH